jgi:hypothetical protein
MGMSYIWPWTGTTPVSGEGDESARQQIFSILSKPTHGLLSITGPFDENIIFWLILLKASKTPEGLNKVLDLLKTVILETSDVLGDVARAGAANEIQAWSSGRLTSQFMERFGMITRSQAGDYIRGLNVLVGIETATGVLTDILHGKTFPDTLHLGAKIKGTAKTIAVTE